MVLAQTGGTGVSIGDLIWIIILISALQPAVQRYVLTVRRLRTLRSIERQRSSRAIAMIHRQETMRFLRFPILRYIDIQDSDEGLADIAGKALRQVCDTVQGILQANGMAAERAKAIAEELSTGKWTHDDPLDVEKLKTLGLAVSDKLPNDVFQLMALYPQPPRGQPSVEYIPVPYARPGQRSQPGSK